MHNYLPYDYSTLGLDNKRQVLALDLKNISKYIDYWFTENLGDGALDAQEIKLEYSMNDSSNIYSGGIIHTGAAWTTECYPNYPNKTVSRSAANIMNVPLKGGTIYMDWGADFEVVWKYGALKFTESSGADGKCVPVGKTIYAYYTTDANFFPVSKRTFNPIGKTAEPIVSTPTFSPEPQTYPTEQSVSISTITQDAIIRYTLDGVNDPNEASTIYLTPIPVCFNNHNQSKSLENRLECQRYCNSNIHHLHAGIVFNNCFTIIGF